MSDNATLSAPKIYLIPGLGADQRLFHKLTLNFPYEVLPWLAATKNESLESYVKRMGEGIDWSANPIVGGVSFGGMIAVEMSKYFPVQCTILISSIKTRNELPFLLRMIGGLGLHKMVPTALARRRSALLYWYFGVTTTLSKDLLGHILQGSDPAFMRWAVTQIGRWKNERVPHHLLHLHGTNDRVFPISKVADCVPIEGGHHFMVVDRNAEIATHINAFVDQFIQSATKA